MVGEGREVVVNQEHRLLAMLAHLLAIPLPLLAPLIMYLVKRETPFVAFHALQELFFQLAMTLAATIAALLIVVLIGVVLLPLVGIVALVFPIIAGIKSYNGEWYEYPVIGAWVRRQFQL